MTFRNFRPCRHHTALCAVLLTSVCGHAAESVTIETRFVPAQAAASSECTKDQVVQHLIDGSGLAADNRHDQDAGAHTMWHSASKPAPSAPAPGLASFPAWVRFDFPSAQPVKELRVWNHNQANLLQRGFRQTRVFGSTDGQQWQPLASVELAKGGDTAQAIPLGAGQPLKAIVIAAESNWGDDYYGLSEVAFVQSRKVAPAEVPAPTALTLSNFPFLYDDHEKPHRNVEIDLGDTPLYEAAELTVSCGGATARTHFDASPLGRRKLLAALPAGKADTRKDAAKVSCTLQTSRWNRSAEGEIKAATEWPDLEEVVVVVKTHFDIGYTHRVKEVVNYYRTEMIDRALNAMDASKSLSPEQQFAWTGPGWVMSKVLDDWQGQTPERRKRLDEYVKAGKFRWHALPFSLESDACEPEEMARGFSFASNLSRKFGQPLSVAGKMSDVPCHGNTLSTVLANGGIKFMHIGGNWPSGYVTTPGLFWWEGPDGSRTLTFYNGTYGTATGFNWPHNWGDGEPFVGHNFLPPANWPHKIWPAILVTMDNSGPPSADAVRALFDEAAQRIPGVKIRMGSMDDFANIFLATKPELPVVKAEMPDTWLHGVMSDPRGIATSRRIHPLLSSAEALNTQLGLWGVPQPAIAKDIAQAYENTLLYGEHTWGRSPAVSQYGDDFPKANPALIADLEASWEDKTDYIRTAAKIADSVTTANLAALAKTIKAPAGSAIVYNPLPWSRSGTVELDGKTLTAMEVPPCGYRVVSNEPASAPANVLENQFFKLTLDPAKGGIASLIDKRSGREWVDAAAERGLGQYLNERFTYEQTRDYTVKYQSLRKNPWIPHPGMHKGHMPSEKQVPYRAATSSNGVVKTGKNSAVIECPADPANHKPATTLRVTLLPDQPGIDLELTIQDKAKDNWPEADWLCLPFKVGSPQFRVHRQLGVMDPVTGILPGANRDLFSTGNGVTLTDADGSGIAITPLDHMLVSLDRPGCWKFSKNAEDFTPTKPVVYLNLYNNQWNTNFRYWYTGSWSSRVRLRTFDAKTPAGEQIDIPALEARNPLQAIAATGDGQQLPASHSGIAASRKGVVVTAFGSDPDGHPGTLLRVWEQAGLSGELTLTVPGPFRSAAPVNLRGEPAGKPIAITDGKLSLDLHAYAPASFILSGQP